MVGGSTLVYAGTIVRLTSARSILALGALALSFQGVACKRETPAPSEAPREAALDVAFAGCAAVIVRGDRTVCELGEARALRLVPPEGAKDVSVEVDGRRVDARPDDAGAPGASAEDGGAWRASARSRARLVVDVPASGRGLVVRGAVAGKPAAFALDLEAAPKTAWLDDAKAARQKGDLAAARALLAPHQADPRAKGLLARITLAEGRAAEAFPLFRAAIAAGREGGRVSDVVDDSLALAFALHQRSHRYDEARAALDAIAPELPRYPEGRAREPYYRGILASETGDRRAASALLHEAGSRAEMLGMSRLERNARAAVALEMQAMGRFTESLEILRALANDPEVKGCERAEIANDIGWGLLLAKEDGARAPLAAAASVEGCADAYLQSFALANLARLELDAGDAGAARRRLDEARARVKEPRGTERLAWLDLEAHITLREGGARAALATFDEERSLARAALLLEYEWAALVGRAEALGALGRDSDASAAFLEAEAIVERAMLLVPLGGGRSGFLAQRSRSASDAIGVLVKLGRVDEAAEIARRSRARLLAGVERALRVERLTGEGRARWEAAVRAYRDARDALDREAGKDWALPAQDLLKATEARRAREKGARDALEAAIAALADAGQEAPRPRHTVAEGDVELVLHPAPGGAVAFLADASRTTAHAFAAPPDVRPDPAHPLALPEAVLSPLAARLRGARRLRVLAYGALRGVDVHALVLPGRAGPLVETVVVDYPLGLSPRAEPARGAHERRAVVVGDPLSDLPHARAEAEAAARALRDRTKVQTFLGAEATSRALTSALPRAELFHYAGHGIYAGVEGFESALPLADGGRLTVGDLLALSPAPRTVVLSGCDAARSAGAAEGLGLAQALVVAGSEEVLAPVRPVPDALAAKLADALYAAADGGGGDGGDGTFSLASRARAALARLRAENPASDWAAFRVIAR